METGETAGNPNSVIYFSRSGASRRSSGLIIVHRDTPEPSAFPDLESRDKRCNPNAAANPTQIRHGRRILEAYLPRNPSVKAEKEKNPPLLFHIVYPVQFVSMDEPDGALTADDLHLSNVDRTLRELQRMVQEHEDTLSQVCFESY